jgi:hypothetical protein
MPLRLSDKLDVFSSETFGDVHGVCRPSFGQDNSYSSTIPFG